MTEDEMVGWHHQLNEHEFEQAPGVGDGQESLVCCSPWGHKQLDTAKWLTQHFLVQLTKVHTFNFPPTIDSSKSMWVTFWKKN